MRVLVANSRVETLIGDLQGDFLAEGRHHLEEPVDHVEERGTFLARVCFHVAAEDQPAEFTCITGTGCPDVSSLAADSRKATARFRSG
jgi:hypothetical protein